MKSVVSLGFFIEQAYDVNHAAVFNLERPHGQARQDVSIKQIREVPLEIANRLDNDETLSAVRELYFYKTFAYLYESKHPKQELVVGGNVVFKKQNYALIQRSDDHALIENDDGRTQVVKVKDLERGFTKQTVGHTDGFFDVSGDLSLYSGQWVFMPARREIEDKYDSKWELAVVCGILQGDRVEVYRALDGTDYFVADENVLPLSKGNQEILNSHAQFKRFKDAVVHKDAKKALAYAFGSTHARLCAGLWDNLDLNQIKKMIDEKAKPDQTKGKSNLDGPKEDEGHVGHETVGYRPEVPKTMEQVEEGEPDIYDADDSGIGAGLVVVAFLAAWFALAGRGGITG